MTYIFKDGQWLVPQLTEEERAANLRRSRAAALDDRRRRIALQEHICSGLYGAPLSHYSGRLPEQGIFDRLPRWFRVEEELRVTPNTTVSLDRPHDLRFRL